MFIQIEPESPKTKEYLRYIFRELLDHGPLRDGKIIEIRIVEGLTPFPEFTEIPLPPRSGPAMTINSDGQKTYFARNLLTSDKDVSGQIMEKGQRRDSKADLLYSYTQFKLMRACKTRCAEITDSGPIDIEFSFTIDDRKQVYLDAERLGLVKIGGDDASSKNELSPPKFFENPPHILWGETKIPIPPNSKQLCACRIAFRKKIGEIISWDEVAAEIEGVRKQDVKTNWHSVYDTLRQINKKVKTKTDREIYKVSKLSFYRLA